MAEELNIKSFRKYRRMVIKLFDLIIVNTCLGNYFEDLYTVYLNTALFAQ
jgi:hypothetical protein